MIAKKLALWSGVGLVIANMIGGGVLIETGSGSLPCPGSNSMKRAAAQAAFH